MSYGWSLNHWQQIEGGRPISLRTLLRICEVFAVPMDQLVQGLDDYIVGYRSSDDPRGARRSRRQSAGWVAIEAQREQCLLKKRVFHVTLVARKSIVLAISTGSRWRYNGTLVAKTRDFSGKHPYYSYKPLIFIPIETQNQ